MGGGSGAFVSVGIGVEGDPPSADSPARNGRANKMAVNSPAENMAVAAPKNALHKTRNKGREKTCGQECDVRKNEKREKAKKWRGQDGC
jgi:hypothetical protein